MEKDLFDNWAESYNYSIKKSDEDNTYPFAGYGKIQEYVYITVKKRKKSSLLEMGIGTGLMTKRLYDIGHSIVGVDFSPEMIKRAKNVMPQCEFIESNFLDIPKKLGNRLFDFIVFSFSIHHLKYEKQRDLLCALSMNLTNEGMIIIGDVMTETNKEMDEIAENNKSIWDYDEHYPIFEKYSEMALDQKFSIEYIQTSFCTGIFKLVRKPK